MVDIPPMDGDEWKDRLKAAIKKSGRSMRDVSIAAGYSHGYISGLYTEEKTPSAAKLIKICDELGVSPFQILYGFELTSDAAELLRLYSTMSDEDKVMVLRLMKKTAGPAGEPGTPSQS